MQTENSTSRFGVGDIFHLPAYPFLIGALPAVHFHEVNFRLLQGLDLLRPLLLAFLLVSLVLLVGRLIWRNFAAAAVVLAPLVVVIFKGQDVGGWLSLVLVAVSIGLGVFLKRSVRTWPTKLALPLNVVLLILVAIPLVSAWQASGRENTPVPSAFFNSEIPLPAAAPGQVQPDIYYIMVDGLGRPGFVEAEFPLPKDKYSGLFVERGFQVLRNSYANYPQTALSTTATLNLGLIDQVLDIADPQSKDRRVLAQVAGDSRAVRALRKRGYRVVSFPSGYPLTRQSLTDKRRSPAIDPSFVEYYLLEDGVLPLILPLLGKGPADVSFAMRRGRLNFICDQFPTARQGVAAADPVFVYAHLLAPHPPFVFGRQGQALSSRAEFAFADGNHWLNIHGRDDTSYRQRYADQAVWIMQRLAHAVDRINASSNRPKIIIIQGDHGPGSGLEWEQPQRSDHNERFGIFNAWYVSDGRQLPLYEGMTALNTFPMLFNSFFSGNLARLPDDYWFARMSQPYTFYELSR